MDGESGELTRVRRSGRSMNRKNRDRGAEMRLTERTRKLIPRCCTLNADNGCCIANWNIIAHLSCNYSISSHLFAG